jgi:hypothetical protein
MQANLLLVGALFLGLILAIVLGSTVGQSDFKPLMLTTCAAVAVLFAVHLYRYFWQMALFLCFFGFSYRPTSFAFGGVELSCALGFAVVGIFFWQRKSFKRPAILDHPSFKFAERLLFIWLAYVALHMVFNIKAPVSPGEFKLSNAVKSYFGWSAPLLLLFILVRSPGGLVVGKNFFWTVARICLLGLLINLGIRLYELAGGWPVFIPVVNGTSNGHILRALGPMSMLIGIAGLTGDAARRSGLRWLVFCALLVLGTAGATLSGGRAAVVFGFVGVCGVLVLRRKIAALGIVLFVGILAVAAANLSSSWINQKANPFFQRSVQWLLLDKNTETVVSLESSTDWRKELASRAIDEWKSDPRIFWTGRATFGFGVADETAIVIAGGYEALIRTSLRRGATHNLTTDLLLIYGVIGCVLYYGLYIALLRFLWTIHRSRKLSPAGQDLALCCLVGAGLSLGLGIIAGGIYPADQVWLLIVLIGAFYSGHALRSEQVEHATARVPEVPTQRPVRRFRERALVRR